MNRRWRGGGDGYIMNDVGKGERYCVCGDGVSRLDGMMLCVGRIYYVGK